jgi:hypothetical protein
VAAGQDKCDIARRPTVSIPAGEISKKLANVIRYGMRKFAGTKIIIEVRPSKNFKGAWEAYAAPGVEPARWYTLLRLD